MKKESEDKTQDNKSFLRFNLLIALLCGLLILAHFLSSFFPKSRLWGINHLAYFPLWVRLVFTFLGLLVLVPGINSKVYSLFELILSFFQRIFAKREVLGYAFLILVSMFFFWLLKTKTHFLGDGYYSIYQLNTEKYIRIGIEPLEIFAHLYIYKFLKLFFTPSGEGVYAGMSILAGGVFVFFSSFLSRSLAEDRFDRTVIFSLLIFSGATQLFLGYVEHYTLTYVSALAYIYFSLRYLQGKGKIFLPIFTCILSVAFHFSLAYLLPSLFFLFILRENKGELVFNLNKALPYILILFSILLLSVYYIWSMHHFLLEIFIPFLKERAYAPGYTLFSFSHLLDMLNQYLLLSPAGLILLISLAGVYKNKIKLKDPIIVFLIIVGIGQFLYHFSVDPKFGAVKDWDLFSSVALGFTLLSIYLFINLIESKRYSGVVLLFTALLSTLPFFMLNANDGRAIARLKDFLDLDVKRGLAGRYSLITYYLQQDNPIEAEKIRAEIYKAFPEDSLNRMAKFYMKSGNLDKATSLLKRVVELNPRYQVAYNDLGMIYLKQGKIDQAIELFKSILQTDPFNPQVHVNLGLAFMLKEELGEAKKELEKSIEFGIKKPEVYFDLASIYLRLGETEKAINSFKEALRINPRFYYAHFGLGQIYLEMNLLDEALAEFSQVAKLQPDFASSYYHLGLVYERKGLREKAIEQFKLFLRYSSDEAQNEKVRGWLLKLRSQKP